MNFKLLIGVIILSQGLDWEFPSPSHYRLFGAVPSHLNYQRCTFTQNFQHYEKDLILWYALLPQCVLRYNTQGSMLLVPNSVGISCSLAFFFPTNQSRKSRGYGRIVTGATKCTREWGLFKYIRAFLSCCIKFWICATKEKIPLQSSVLIS